MELRNKAERDFLHPKLDWVYHPLEACCWAWTWATKYSRGRTGNLEQSRGAGTWRKAGHAGNLLSNGIWSKAIRQGQDLRRLTWENQGMTVYQMGFWHERRDWERA